MMYFRLTIRTTETMSNNSESFFSVRSREKTPHNELLNQIDCTYIMMMSENQNMHSPVPSSNSDTYESVVLLPETHFKVGTAKAPETVLYFTKDSLSKSAVGKTIFDCELGCFITVEE